MKPTLRINQEDIHNFWRTLGKRELLTNLVNSDLFNIAYHPDSIKTLRGEHACILYYNDKKVYLDLWEYNTPTYTKEVYDFNFDLIIKLQYKPLTIEQLEKTCNRKNILKGKTQEERFNFYNKTVPWIFFSSRMVKQFIGKESELEKLPIERFAFFCGKKWKTRNKWYKKIEEENKKGIGIELIASKQEIRAGRPLTDSEYIHMMRTSKFGLILHGRGSHLTQAKNRREMDYMILKKPLLMNYEPSYYNPLIAGKHYILFDEKTELNKIEDMYNIDEIAENGHQWYKENASPMGSAQSFLQIMKDKFGE